MSKTVQIKTDLFCAICRYFLFDDRMDDDEIQTIIDGLQDKLDAMQRHDLYAQYKDKSASEADRQAARIAYLEAIGMADKYRWTSLDPPT